MILGNLHLHIIRILLNGHLSRDLNQKCINYFICYFHASISQVMKQSYYHITVVAYHTIPKILTPEQ